jgi:hypothetical protein
MMFRSTLLLLFLTAHLHGQSTTYGFSAGPLFTLLQYQQVVPAAEALLDLVQEKPLETASDPAESPVDLRRLGFQLKPNPAVAGFIEIILPEEAWVDVLDLTGRVVLHQSFPAGTSQITFSGRPKGVYLIRTPFGTRRVVYPGEP